ncbi:MAG: SDR family oxidoreductase [Candidatus Anaerobiospirillum pullicola]|uniref:SDR family oxidoreductase n=1 Tax=Candidatus Anaerobiospirillum pullicola TaxID=2838451 RepID=A0A948WY80_9GAMM|nr:SDR family oxidoreductase [Candidatus Anaerobiospirillum pullicola]
MVSADKVKVIAITGGATGIGRACVRKFLAEGYSVAFADINVPAAHELLAMEDVAAAEREGRVLFAQVDTKERAALKAWVDATLAKFGHLDAVFANAGIHRSNTILDVSDEELELVINTNIYGTIYTVQATLPHIIANGGGSVVLCCSDQFFIGKGCSFAYGLTKGALGQITRSLAIDYGPKNVRVNAVCPSTIHTPLSDDAMNRYAQRSGQSLASAWQEEDNLFVLKRAGYPEEVAAMVFFLTDQASFCTGAHYLVDGGIVAY